MSALRYICGAGAGLAGLRGMGKKEAQARLRQLAKQKSRAEKRS